LRGLAALAVVFYHLPPWIEAFFEVHLIRNFYLMVDFFFVLSGFVMAMNYADALKTPRQIGRFTLLRFIRLYPVHFVFLFFFFALECLKYLAQARGISVGNAVAFRENSLAALVENLFLVQGLGIPGASSTFNGPSWSISTGFYTYLVFAFSVFAFGKNRLVKFASLYVALAFAAILLQDYEPILGILRCLFGFFTGCLVFEAFDFKRRTGKTFKHPQAWSAAFALAIVLFLEFKPLHFADFLIVPLSAGLILCMLDANVAFLENGPFRKLGQISYSLYMAHALVIWVANQVLRFIFKYPEVPAATGGSFPRVPFAHGLIIYPVTAGLCLVAGYLTFRFVELPSHNFVKKLRRQWKQ
jgi:peptidoglycan/LPS O-acetylase OafA/YrhL